MNSLSFSGFDFGKSTQAGRLDKRMQSVIASREDNATQIRDGGKDGARVRPISFVRSGLSRRLCVYQGAFELFAGAHSRARAESIGQQARDSRVANKPRLRRLFAITSVGWGARVWGGGSFFIISSLRRSLSYTRSSRSVRLANKHNLKF